jgi:hypothetical protein
MERVRKLTPNLLLQFVEVQTGPDFLVNHQDYLIPYCFLGIDSFAPIAASVSPLKNSLVTM